MYYLDVISINKPNYLLITVDIVHMYIIYPTL